MELLTKLEELALLAVIELGDEAYGISVYKHINKITDQNLSISSIYFPLDRLVEKGYLSTYKGESTPKRGGIRKKHYSITEKGIKILQQMKDINDISWQSFYGLSKLSR
ncbi:MAG: PadR family transcriptional regulator [bacterium]|nr:PadR family transcriptional regulator [bacterium]